VRRGAAGVGRFNIRGASSMMMPSRSGAILSHRLSQINGRHRRRSAVPRCSAPLFRLFPPLFHQPVIST